MMKAVAIDGKTGRMTLLIGLSFGNLNKFKKEPLDTFIKINGADLDLPIDVTIFSGESEPALQRFMADKIGPETKVSIDPRFKD